MNQKIGLFVNELLVKEYEYEDYPSALSDASTAYIVTGVPHEIKLSEVNEIV